MDKNDMFEILNLSDIDDVSEVKIKIDSHPKKSVKRRIIVQIAEQKKVFPYKKFFVSVACFVLIFSLSITVLANNTFKKFLFSIFDVTPQITEENSSNNTTSPQSTEDNSSDNNNTSLNIVKAFDPGENIIVRSGFLIANKKVFSYQNGKMLEAKQLHCTGEYVYLDKPIIFSFDYFISKQGIMTFNHVSDLSFSVTTMPGNTSKAIFIVNGLKIEEKLSSGQIITEDSFIDSFLIDLQTGKLQPIVNRDGADKFFEKKNPKVYDSYTAYQTRHFADAEPSKDGSYISFKTNRNYFPAVPESGKYMTDYYIRNLETGEEWKVQFTHKSSPYKAYWINDKTIAFIFSHSEEGIIIEFYNAETKTSKLSHRLYTDEVVYANNSLYEITKTENSFIFTDLIDGKNISIQKDIRVQGMVVPVRYSENNYYILSGDNGLIIYNLRDLTCTVISKDDFNADRVLFPYFVEENVILLSTETNGIDSPSFYLVALN